VLQCPEGLDWLASEYTAQHCPEGVDNDDRHDSPASNLKLPCGEHTSVLQKDRDLRKAERKVVNDEAGVESLDMNFSDCITMIGGDVPSVSEASLQAATPICVDPFHAWPLSNVSSSLLISVAMILTNANADGQADGAYQSKGNKVVFDSRTTNDEQASIQSQKNRKGSESAEYTREDDGLPTPGVIV
jgi:hypothetical protein